MIIELHDRTGLERLLEQSQKEPILLFKHSTQCSRSAAVIEGFDDFEKANPSVTCGLILVIEYRDVSDDIEDRFGIRHESPQVIIFRRGKANPGSMDHHIIFQKTGTELVFQCRLNPQQITVDSCRASQRQQRDQCRMIRLRDFPGQVNRALEAFVARLASKS